MEAPGPDNRVFKVGTKNDAVLKITFAELLRSCSQIIGCARTSPSNLKDETAAHCVMVPPQTEHSNVCRL